MLLGKMNWANLLDYDILPSDMELFQTYVNDMSKQRILGERTAGIIYGAQISILSGMQLQVSQGLALMPDGTLVYIPQTNFTIAAADPSNPRKDRIEISFLAMNNTNVLDVNSVSKVLDVVYSPSVTQLVGTPGATPVAPSPTGANVSIGIVTVPTGSTSVLTGNVSQAIDTAFITSAIQLGNKSAFIRYNQSKSILQFSNDGVRYQGFGSGGGGGGAGANWQDVDGLAVTSQIEFGDKSLLFSQGDNQAVSLFVKVPSGYLSGSPLSMKLNHYSPSASGFFKFQATTTLIRKDVDALGSTANQFVSTNGDVTNMVANQNREVLYDLSSVSGVIGSTTPNPGDLILIQIQRITPTGTPDDTADVRMIPSSTEVSFA